MKTIVLPPSSIEDILSIVELSKERQQEIVNRLADEDPHAFIESEDQEVHSLIYLRLTQETVAHYLFAEGILSTEYSSHFTEEGHLVMESYVVEETEEVKAALQKMLRSSLKKKKRKSKRG